jgi:CRISPR-associated endonuclease Csn1
MSKRVLGLDLGTNSIGWALVESDFEKKTGKINGIGSRIIPMTQDVLDNFGNGQSHSQTDKRTAYRGIRRLYQRNKLRRERLHRVLNILDFLPKHYKNAIDFENKLGQFIRETKLNYYKDSSGENKFLFVDSFNEMVNDFKKEQPQLFYENQKGEQTKIPYDWTIYYLRKKALNKKISKAELSWLLLNFNQKRGYYQLRGEEEELTTKQEEFYALKVTEVEETEDKNAKGIWYNVHLENGMIYRRQSKVPLNNWIGNNKEFIVTTQLEDGKPKKDKEGNIKRSFRAVDSEKDWIAIKEKTQQEIDKSGKTVGTYIYETLLKNPSQKINGKLVKTIERKFYKDELNAILKEQIKHHPELTSKAMYKACVEELYTYNQSHKNNILNKRTEDMFRYLFMDDIIFYQRPLKSKKSTIAGCQYEVRKYKKKNIDGNIELIEEPLKVIPKSNPLFIEFRLWQFLRNLRIYKIEGTSDIDITNQCFQDAEEWCDLYDFLNDRKEVEQKNIIEDYLIKKTKRLNKADKEIYRWNYVVDKKYPINETRSQILSRIKRVKGTAQSYNLDKQTEQKLWHIIYSVKDKSEYKKALKTFARKNNFDTESFVSNFEKFPPFKSEYGSYSEKAIKKILPLMRMGRYWNADDVPKDVNQRINSIVERIEYIQSLDAKKTEKMTENEIIDLVADDEIPRRLIKSFINHPTNNPLSGLNTYQACYAVYERHSEVSVIQQWKSPSDIDQFLNQFKQHSLRNPIVEQVVLETLRTVRDIWVYNLQKDKDFKFSEIHLELGRDMKNSADKRKRISDKQTKNENTNTRIKLLLEELKRSYADENIRPFSPSHQEILKIYEEGVYQNPEVSYQKVSEEDIDKIRSNANPTPTEITRYKLWLEQSYISPYTGQPIPLSKLFSTDYQIEHIIPQSRYFDNSMSNKVICESAINPNPYKDNQTGYEFIKNMGGQIVPELSTKEKTVKLFTLEQYQQHCEKYFKKNRPKLKYLLSDDIPEGFINRQMNDSRYISKYVKALLSNIVRADDEKEATAKNLIPVSGAITSKLKQDWGLNDIWNKLIESRFKRLNELTKSNDFGYLDYPKDEKGNRIGKEFFRLVAPKGVSKKRIDHRHHALDALVIACTSRKHIQYLNSLSNETKKYGLQPSLMVKNKEGHYTKHFQLPWSTFPIDAKNSLEKTIISFKKNTRVLTKTNNKYWSYKDEKGNLRLDKNGNPKKALTKQLKGDSKAIRKPLHKEFVYKKLNHIQTPKNKIATAIRTDLSDIKTAKHINAITDESIKKILRNHLENYIDEKNKKRFDLAFSPEGVEELNKNIIVLNGGKRHKPIYKVRIYEIGSRFSVSEDKDSTKNKKYVEAAKGTNLFFGVYWNEAKQKREFDTVPLNVVIERLKQKLGPVPEILEKDKTECNLLFYLSPNDLVYVPTEEEAENPQLVDFNKLNNEQVNRIYKMVSSTGNECHFIKHDVSGLIKKYDSKSKIGEYGSLNKSELTICQKNRIKVVCRKLQVDRLGNIVNVLK